jgi:hypothetical protein
VGHPTADSRMTVTSSRTLTLTEIRYQNLHRNVSGYFKKSFHWETQIRC